MTQTENWDHHDHHTSCLLCSSAGVGLRERTPAQYNKTACAGVVRWWWRIMTLRNWNVSYSHSPLYQGIPTLSYHSCLHPTSEKLPDPSQILFRLMTLMVVANLAAALCFCLLGSVRFAHYILSCRYIEANNSADILWVLFIQSNSFLVPEFISPLGLNGTFYSIVKLYV